MKRKSPDNPLPADGKDFEFADYGVEEETIVRYLLKLLEPHLATEPLAPAACQFLGTELCNHRLSVKCARMEMRACMEQYGPSDHRTISARVNQ